MTRDDFTDLALASLSEVTAFARRLTQSGVDADDLVQATFERAFTTWTTLKEPRACRAWLFQIARNLHVDQLRAAHTRPALALIDESDAPAPPAVVDADSVERLDAREIDAALANLADDRREAVMLCDIWGFTYDEIATITAVPVGTVRSRIARGRADLARWLVATAATHDIKGRNRP